VSICPECASISARRTHLQTGDARAGGNTSRRQEGRNDGRRLCAAASACRSCGQRAKRHVSAKAETWAGVVSEAGVSPKGETEAESARAARRGHRAGGSKNRDASGGAVLAVVRAARQRREGGGLRVKGRD